MIREELQGHLKPINSVKPHPKNVRQGDVGAIAQSLQTHGQYTPILTQKKTGHIVKGNHTWAAAKVLGWEEIAVLELDITDRKALELLLTDNKTSDQAMYDDNALAELLESLAKDKRSLEGTGYNGDDLDDLLASFQERFLPSLTPYGGAKPSSAATVSLSGPKESEDASYFSEITSPSAVRGIVLDYPVRDFTWVVSAFAKVRGILGVDSNAEVVVALLEQAIGETKPV